ncbi:MAG: YdbH domain-containing protein [Rhodospirillales bacterium]|nr:YdbH domain-containing protein [Rhodospirillales bacterium]
MATFAFRHDLVTHAIRIALDTSDANPVNFRVEEANFDRLVLSAIHAGPEAAVKIERLIVAYTPTALMDRRIDRLDIDGLTVHLQANEDGVSIAGLDAIQGRPDNDDGRNWTIETVALKDAVISMDAPVGSRMTINGDIRAIADDRFHGALHFDGVLRVPGATSTDVEGAIEFTASSTSVETAQLTLRTPNLPFPHLDDAQLDAVATLKGKEIETKGTIKSRQGDVLFEIAGAIPDDGDWRSLRGTGTIAANLADVAISEANATLSAVGQIAAVITSDGLSVTALKPLEFKALTPSGPMTARVEPNDAPMLEVQHEQGRFRSAMLHVADATVSGADHVVQFTEGDAVITLEPTPMVAVRSLTVTDLSKSRLAPPLNISGRATLEQTRIPFDATMTAADEKMRVDVTGTWNRDTETAEADIRMHPVRFAPGNLQPKDLAPTLNAPISNVKGRVSAQGTLAWRDGRLRPNLLVRIEKTEMEVQGFHLQGLAGAVRVIGFDPPRTPRGQRIKIDRVMAGVPMTDADIRFQLDARQRVHIESATVNLLGGRASQSNAIFDTAKTRYQGTLDLTGVSLQALLDLVELDGSTATGHVGGRIPITFESGKVSITGGTLSTESPGVLRYIPLTTPTSLLNQGEGVTLALRALENFHYQSLGVGIDGGAGRGWTSRLQIAGKNPDFMEGYPFAFNINLSGDLDKVLLSALLGLTLPDRIQERLERK